MSGAERPHSDAATLPALLAWLDPDRERAGEQYEQLRRRLTLFFEARHCQPRAEELADRTLDVVARRLQEGVAIYVREASHYCYGVAQNVLRDHRKGVKLEPLTHEPAVVPPPPPEREQQLQCLEQCLAELPPESRHLIQAYYQEEKRAKINERQQLAQQLGLSLNALRLRAHQIRRKLEASMHSRLERPLRSFGAQIWKEAKGDCGEPVSGDALRLRYPRLGPAVHHEQSIQKVPELAFGVRSAGIRLVRLNTRMAYLR